MRFHLPALPGQPTIAANSSCAYTQKVRRFSTMMRDRGHDVFLYGGNGNDARASEYVPAYREAFPIPFDPALWGPLNAAVIGEIAARIEPGDVICLIAGRCQEVIARAFPDRAAVEFGIGYGGSFADFRVFESYAWMHSTYAAQGGTDPHALDGNAYHAVIPNYFDLADFPDGGDGVSCAHGSSDPASGVCGTRPCRFHAAQGEGDHLLYVGRLIERKGVEVAVNVARATRIPLLLAGEGDYRPGEGEGGITYLGAVGPEDRSTLMAEARALLAPTTYIEPFGGAAVEAQLCGTPAITTDWGAYAETVAHGCTGYRCRRLGEFIWAAEHAGELDRAAIAARARARYSIEAIAPRYEAYFAHLETLRSGGWYDPTPARPGLASLA
jgi:glycosyltransferase involved in cell wall biosynthesis